MLSVVEAKKKGIEACMDALGRDFCMEHKDNALSGYEEPINDVMRCFVTVSDSPPNNDSHEVGGEPMPYQAFIDVDMKTGNTILVELIAP